MNPIYIIFIVIYLSGLIVFGIVLSRRVRTGADFMVAGRKLSLPILVGTLVATWIGSGTIVASAGLSYRVGFSALWGSSGGWFGICLLFLIASRARRFGAFTVPDLLEARYNPAARLLGTLVTLIAYTVITSYQFRAGGMVLNLVAGIDPRTGMALTAVFVIAYTALAGMLSVAYTDFVNGIVLTAGILLAVPVVLIHTGGWDTVTATLEQGFFSPFHGETSGVGALNLFLPTLLLLLGESNMYSRFFSARNDLTLSRTWQRQRDDHTPYHHYNASPDFWSSPSCSGCSCNHFDCRFFSPDTGNESSTRRVGEVCQGMAKEKDIPVQ
jgi:SSS family solute:Na+ symporter/sodium/proline symporter